MCITISFDEQYPDIINIISDFVGNNIINNYNNQKILDLYPNIYKNIELKKTYNNYIQKYAHYILLKTCL